MEKTCPEYRELVKACEYPGKLEKYMLNYYLFGEVPSSKLEWDWAEIVNKYFMPETAIVFLLAGIVEEIDPHYFE